MSKQELKWIGRNNLIGWIRYWYYSKRGWVNPQGYFYKPSRRRRS